MKKLELLLLALRFEKMHSINKMVADPTPYRPDALSRRIESYHRSLDNKVDLAVFLTGRKWSGFINLVNKPTYTGYKTVHHRTSGALAKELLDILLRIDYAPAIAHHRTQMLNLLLN